MTEEKKNFVVEIKNNYHNDLTFAKYKAVIKKESTHKFYFQNENKKNEFIEYVNKIKYFSIVSEKEIVEEKQEDKKPVITEKEIVEENEQQEKQDTSSKKHIKK